MPFDKVSFIAGNPIPDLDTDKKQSHYRKKVSVDGFFVSKIKLVRRDSVNFEMFCHLYLDYYFIEEFLIHKFIWNVEMIRVINPRSNKDRDVKTFFSHSGMYSAYTEINQLMMRDGHVSISTVEEIRAILPNICLTVFDGILEKTWKADLEEYLAQKKRIYLKFFDYNRLWGYIERIATQFADEISK